MSIGRSIFTIVVSLISIAAGIVLAAFVFTSQQAGAQPVCNGNYCLNNWSTTSQYDNDPYLPVNIQVGPGSHDTFFTITDNSRSHAVRYVCGFTSPKQMGTNSNGEKIYVPQVQCNVG